MYTYLCILFIHAVLQLERIILYSNILLLLYVVYNDVLITNNSKKMIFGLFCLMILFLSFMYLYFFFGIGNQFKRQFEFGFELVVRLHVVA